MNTYVCISIFIKYILYIDLKFGILNFKFFMVIMILFKQYKTWTGPEGSRRLRLPNFMKIGI
jgi:hypothetical protein